MHATFRYNDEIERIMAHAQDWYAIKDAVTPLLSQAARELATTAVREGWGHPVRLRDEADLFMYSFGPGFRAGHVVVSPVWMRFFFSIPTQRGPDYRLLEIVRANNGQLRASEPEALARSERHERLHESKREAERLARELA